eukprot:403340667
MGGIQCCEQERPKPKINLDAKIGLYEFAFPNGYEDRQTIDYFVKNWDLKEAQEKTIENKNKDLRQRSTVKKKVDPNANSNANKPSNKGDNSRGSKSNSGSHDNAYLGAGNKYLTDKRSSGNGDKDELQSQGSRSIGSRGGSSNARTGKEGNRLRARLSGVLQQKLRGSFTNLNKNLDLPFDQKRQSSYVKKTSPIVAKEIKKNSQQMEKSKFDNKLDDYLDQEEEEFKLNEDLDSADNNNGVNHAAADDSDLDDDKLHLPLKVQDLNLQPINYRKLANSKQQQKDNSSGDQHLGVQNTKPSYSNPIGVPNGFLKAFTLRNNGNALNGNLKNTSNTIQSDNQREIDRYNNNMDKMDTLKEADSHEEEASKQYSGIIRVTKLE